MHRLFASVIAPLLEALQPDRIVETGAGAGRLTRRVLDAPGAGEAVLHAVDPSPELDPRFVESAGERLQLHPERALGAIAGLGPIDLALLDGDPNWYSVHSELTIALRAAEREGRPAPLTVVHNVHWPFGRRDGYYEPEAIPDAERREYSDLGLIPGQRDPRIDGLRLTPYCAVRDFEPRSGVLSAVEDLITESELEWKVVEVPGFHGVAVLADARLLERHPAVAAVLGDLASPRFLGQQARRAESARLAVEAALAAPPSPIEASAVQPERVEAPDVDSEPDEAPKQATAEPDRELESERATLLAESAEHRAQREAYEWRAGQLSEDLAAQVERLNALVAERDAERRAALETEVRLESAAQSLEREVKAAAALRARIAELEGELGRHRSELAELIERDKLSQGRLAHNEDSLQANRAERDRLARAVARLEADLGATGAQLEEVADHLRQASLTRRARVGRRLVAVGRALTFRRQASSTPLDAARAAAERSPPTAPPPIDPTEVPDLAPERKTGVTRGG